MERQVRLGAGLLVLLGVVLSLFWDRAWISLSAFVGLGLTFAGLTDICGMAFLLAKMPWNKARMDSACRSGKRSQLCGVKCPYVELGWLSKCDRGF